MSSHLFEFVFILSFKFILFFSKFLDHFFPSEECKILSWGRGLGGWAVGSHSVFSSSFHAPMAELELQCGPVCFPSELRKSRNGGTWWRWGRCWCGACLSVCPSATVLSCSLQTEPPSRSVPVPPPSFRESCPHH